MTARSTHKGAAIAADTVVPPDHRVAATAKHSIGTGDDAENLGDELQQIS